ncbi:MAG TPA: hypothetical protein VKY19_01840 [Ktedonosporobacter sp.]|jgi:hypothetical protein|nr:hypothetical protein [Ktedonosporobacter sp.]
MEPLLTVGGPQQWAGFIQFSSSQSLQAWFDSYWATLRPYLIAAHDVDEIAIGTEFERLQNVNPSYWITLLQRVHSVYSGKIIYDMNWTTLKNPPLPKWFWSPLLNDLGVSLYFPLVDAPKRLTQQEAITLWHDRALVWLDGLAQTTGKSVIISEIGYANTAYAGYNPYNAAFSAPRDDDEQALLYNAALQNIHNDSHVIGVFFWAWLVPPYDPSQKPAAQILHQWYSSAH